MREWADGPAHDDQGFCLGPPVRPHDLENYKRVPMSCVSSRSAGKPDVGGGGDEMANAVRHEVLPRTASALRIRTAPGLAGHTVGLRL